MGRGAVGMPLGWPRLQSQLHQRAASPSTTPAIPTSLQRSPEHGPQPTSNMPLLTSESVCGISVWGSRGRTCSQEADSNIGCWSWSTRWPASDEDPCTGGGGCPRNPWHVLVRWCKPPLVVNWDGIPCSCWNTLLEKTENGNRKDNGVGGRGGAPPI